jgi:hypothetical protein
MSFSESTGLYLYSSLVQANAAILAVVAFFFSFKLEKLKSKIHLIKMSIPTAWSPGFTNELMERFENSSITKKREILGSLKKNHVESNNRLPNEKTLDYYHQWYELARKINLIENSLLKPGIMLVISIITFAVLLIFSYDFHIKLENNEVIIFGLALILESYILYFVLKLILEAIKD